jgi:hypothetical protein
VWSGRILGKIGKNNCLYTAINVFNFPGLTTVPSNWVTVGSREDGIWLTHFNRNVMVCHVMLCYVMLCYFMRTTVSTFDSNENEVTVIMVLII